MDRVKVIDIRASPQTMGDVIDCVKKESAAHPEREYLMDGDSYSIMWQSKVIA